MKLRTLLDLCRISNLPTVWSNVLAGAVLGGPPSSAVPVVITGVSGSLLYSGGMLLNDAFDAEIDALERPERPIPSGRVRKSTVFALGYGMLAAALAVLIAFALAGAPGGVRLVGAGVAVALGVLVYDRWHKGVALSPVVMGFCRAGLYAMGALAVSSSFGRPVALPAASLLLYVLGLTYVARFENASTIGRIWPALFVFVPLVTTALTTDWKSDRTRPLGLLVLVVSFFWTEQWLLHAYRGRRGAIPRTVVSLIAGISLVDAGFVVAAAPHELLAVPALVAFALTLFFQRWVRGT